MSGLKIFFYITLSILGLGFLIAALVIYLLKIPKDCTDMCPDYMNGPQCVSVLEKFEDPTIPKPTNLMYQTDFKYASTNGPPFCAPVWYAYRYVKNKNGAYGPLSDWSGKTKDGGVPLAVYSGNVNPPCPPAGCIFPVGEKSCSLNQPVLSILGPLDVKVYGSDAENSYTLNVHRQVGTGFEKDGTPKGFDPKSEGEIVGSCIVTPNKAQFYDIFFNPQTTTGSSCC